MRLTPTTESKLGSDCSGVDGASNRVLTLSNTGETLSGGFLVYASGLALALTTEYTVVHSITGSQITFLNGMWDDMTIVVNYLQRSTTALGYEIKRDDVESIIIDNGVQVTLTRQSTSDGSMGDVTEVTEEEYLIWTLIQDITRKDRQIHEMGLAVPGNSKAFFFHEYDDSITQNGTISVEVGDIITYGEKSWRVEKILSQHQADNNEIFRTGIIKKIDLDEDAT